MAGYRQAAGCYQAGRSLQACAALPGTVSGMWDRLSPAAREVMRLALAESGQLGHGYLGDEHVLLGLLAGQASVASSLLRAYGLDLASARAELQRLSAAGLMPRSRADDAGALRAVGIDVEAVRQRLVTAFGADAVGAAVWRASRRPSPHAAVRPAVLRQARPVPGQLPCPEPGGGRRDARAPAPRRASGPGRPLRCPAGTARAQAPGPARLDHRAGQSGQRAAAGPRRR